MILRPRMSSTDADQESDAFDGCTLTLSFVGQDGQISLEFDVERPYEPLV